MGCFYGRGIDLSLSLVQFDEKYVTLLCVFHLFHSLSWPFSGVSGQAVQLASVS